MALPNPKILFVNLLFAGLFVLFAFSADDRPNIIFIMADDMGYADPGAYGGKLIQTPNIDKMAAEGIRFTDCYVGAPVCAPSRSVLMTGLHSGHTRVRGNFGQKNGVPGIGGGRGLRVPLQEQDTTVAQVLQEAGYVTGMFGKWGLGEPNTTGVPSKKGFDHFFGFLNQRRAHTYFPEFLWLNDHKLDLPGNEDGKQQQYTHDLFTGHALNFIRSHQDQPFFLYLPYCVPHDRYEIPDLGPYADKDWSENEKVYAAMITRMDGSIGRILDLLKELEIDDNTIVFVCSDNGAANRYDHLFQSSGELRGRKRDLTEGGIRTPMVVRWPGVIPKGEVSDVPWMYADFLATAADLAGIEMVIGTDGTSVVPALLGQEATEENGLLDRFFYWEFYEGGFKQAARQGKWKVIRYYDEGNVLQLYDLTRDVGEANDVASQFPEVVADFEAKLAVSRKPSEEWPSPIDPK